MNKRSLSAVIVGIIVFIGVSFVFSWVFRRSQQFPEGIPVIAFLIALGVAAWSYGSDYRDDEDE